MQGDIVEFKNIALRINSNELRYKHVESSQIFNNHIEDLFGIKHSIRVKPHGSRLSSFNTAILPTVHYLVIEEKRDNSADSRVISYVPRNEIVGRTKRVVISFN